MLLLRREGAQNQDLPIAPKRAGSHIGAGGLVSAQATIIGQPHLQVTISVSSSTPTTARPLIDSGADRNFMDTAFCARLGLALEQVEAAPAITAI